MTAHHWFKDEYCHLYGKQTNNKLIGTNGVCIDPEDCITICRWNYRGGVTTPCIYCFADVFEIEY
jgi:hypothetical protein